MDALPCNQRTGDGHDTWACGEPSVAQIGVDRYCRACLRSRRARAAAAFWAALKKADRLGHTLREFDAAVEEASSCDDEGGDD